MRDIDTTSNTNAVAIIIKILEECPYSAETLACMITAQIGHEVRYLDEKYICSL